MLNMAGETMGIFNKILNRFKKAKVNYDKVILECNEAIEINPIERFAYINRGLAYYNKGNYDQAILDYSKAIKLNPRYTDAYFYRGHAYFKKEIYDKAILDYSKAIEQNPRYTDAYFHRGLVYFKKGNYDQAILDYSEMMELDPRDADSYSYRGRAYYKKGDYEASDIDFANAGFLFYVKAQKENWYYLIKSLLYLLKAKKSQHAITYEAKMMHIAFNKLYFGADISDNLNYIESKKEILGNYARNVFIMLKGGDAEINKKNFWKKEFKDEAFSILLEDIKKWRSGLLPKRPKLIIAELDSRNAIISTGILTLEEYKEFTNLE